MATLFFTRTGANPNRADQGRHVSIETVVRGLAGHQTHYFVDQPIINRDEDPSPFSPYTKTVIRIDNNEICPSFPKPGYYFFHSVHPAECLLFLGLSAQ